MVAENGRHYFTSESVTEGHPDKVADQISDAVLDEIYGQDRRARVACETLVTTGLVMVTGEITTGCYVDIPDIVRRKLRDIGYTRAKYGFDGDTCAVLTAIDEQSPDIARGVDQALEVRGTAAGGGLDGLGAGDQGMMFGYAVDETPQLMPLPISLAHRLAQRLASVRHEQILSYLRPDGKTQVTVEYYGGKPVRIQTVIVSAQHHPDLDMEDLKEDLREHVIDPVVPSDLIDGETEVLVNPTGRFVVGGPQADAGLTGRKVIVDTYGGMGRNGGGALSGKDATKVDRSATYAARYVAKNIVASGLASRCEFQVAYAIGVAHPVAIHVDTFDTGQIPDEDIRHVVSECFDLRPAAIIRDLDLLRPLYQQLAAYGHFGRDDLDLPWEETDRVDLITSKA